MSWAACATPLGSRSSTGSSISPAPWAVAIRNDQAVRSRKFTRIPTQRGCDMGASSL